MDFPQRMVALEARLLARFGANGTLTSEGTAYDAETDRVMPTAGAPQTVRMSVGPSETLDEQGREVFRMVAKMQVQPKRGDIISFAGKTFKVGNVVTLYEGDTPTLYVAEVS